MNHKKISNLINGNRLWQRHNDLAIHGEIGNGGVNRQALSNEDINARKQIVDWLNKLNIDNVEVHAPLCSRGFKDLTTVLDSIIKLNIPELNSFFYVTNNNYHPHELSAEIISYYYLNLMNLSKYKNKYPAIIKIDEWFKNIL